MEETTRLLWLRDHIRMYWIAEVGSGLIEWGNTEKDRYGMLIFSVKLSFGTKINHESNAKLVSCIESILEKDPYDIVSKDGLIKQYPLKLDSSVTSNQWDTVKRKLTQLINKSF